MCPWLAESMYVNGSPSRCPRLAVSRTVRGDRPAWRRAVKRVQYTRAVLGTSERAEGDTS
eukprot:3229075-Rhodomonas_salina.1